MMLYIVICSIEMIVAIVVIKYIVNMKNDEIMVLKEKIKKSETKESKLEQTIDELNQKNKLIEGQRIEFERMCGENVEYCNEVMHQRDMFQEEGNKIKAENEQYKRFVRELQEKSSKIKAENEQYKKFMREFQSNRSAIPYLAGMIADIETYGLEQLAQGLDWGSDRKRLDKVKSIREIRKDAQAMVEKNKEAQYQLAYLLELFPNLKDVIECDYSQLPMVQVSELSEYDGVRDYLSKDEYLQLSVIERNQLALDRYIQSKNKSKWQIGRDYEQYVGYIYRQKGYEVDDFGTYMGLEDLGRDIIAKKGDFVHIVQCKYWSSVKQIHEKHITQLYGTLVSYCVENNVSQDRVTGVLVTNIQLSPKAKEIAAYLHIHFVENLEMGKYPCIKCNLGHGKNGETKIYHLPFDQKYDVTKIRKPGEFYAMTVKEAEEAGFRRSYKWFGNK